MKRILMSGYAIFSYVVGIFQMLFVACWITNNFVPKTIDSGEPGPLIPSLVINTVLLFVFCFAHSIFARTSVKTVLRRYVPVPLERATYCLFFSVLLVLLCLLWRPMPGVVWEFTSSLGIQLMYGLFIASWVIHFWGIFLLNHNEFFGLRQAFFAARGEPYEPLPAMGQGAYYWSHVLLVVGLALIPWFTPTMSVGHLYFAVFLTGYNGIGAWLSHRDTGGIVQVAVEAGPAGEGSLSASGVP